MLLFFKLTLGQTSGNNYSEVQIYCIIVPASDYRYYLSPNIKTLEVCGSEISYMLDSRNQTTSVHDCLSVTFCSSAEVLGFTAD
jgi:hypothetical protein